MRVATFNILHGRTVGDGVDPQRLRDCVRRLDPDVLALQEVDRDQPRSEHADLTAAAADAMGAVEHRFVAAISGTPGATWVAATGREQPGTAAYGIALLSRFPVSSWQVLRLPRIPMRFPHVLARAQQGDDGRRGTAGGGDRAGAHPAGAADGGEHPSVVRARLESAPAAPTGSRPARPAGPTAARRRPQPHTVRRYTAGRACDALASAATFPSAAPNRQLDHIVTDDTGLRGDAVEAELMPISDHRPLLVELRRVRPV